MVALPPPINGLLFYNNQWNDVTSYMRQTEQITVTRGMTSEGSQADPSEGSVLMDNRDGRFSAKNPNSPLFGLIGRNTPMRLSLDLGTPWLDVPDAPGDARASTPDDAALDITGDIDVRVDCRLKNWNPGTFLILANKNQTSTSGNQISWRLLQLSSGKLELTWSTDGTGAGGKTAASTIELPTVSGHRVAIKATLDVDNGLGGYTVWFYTAPAIEGPWTALGDPTVTTTGTTSIFNSTSPVEVGSATGLGLRDPIGKFYAFQLRNGIDGTLVADADFTSRTPGDLSWADSVGRTWTISDGASISNTHVRLVGEVPAWPPRRDLSGNEKNTPIKPTGIFRRLSSGSKPLKSASYRAIILNPDSDLLAYWPCEDEEDATSLAAATANTQPMAITTAGATLHADSSFRASDALPKMGFGRFNAAVPSYTFGLSSQVRFFMKIPTAGVTSGALIATFRANGSVAEYRLQYFVTGFLRFSAYDGNGTLVGDSFNVTFNPQGRAVRFHLGITQSGANIEWTMAQLEQGATVGNALVGTFNSLTAGAITSVSFGDPANGLGDTVIGQISVNSANGSLFDQSQQLGGWFEEAAGSRIGRLCGEEGIYREVAGYSAHEVQLGVQGIDSLVALLSESAEADQGLLFDTRDVIGVRYRDLYSLQNQVPAFTLDFSQGLISAPFEPIDDDKLTENSVVVEVRGGSSSAPAVLTTGPMSIQDPPDGVGLYDVSEEYNLNNANTAGWIAGWRLNRGTFNGLRYTSITLDLANPRVFEMLTEILEADVGDTIRLTNLPSDLPPDDVDLLVIGYSETIGPEAWQMTFVCVPGEPFEIGGLPVEQDSLQFATNDHNRADLTGSTLLTTMDADDVSLEAIMSDEALVPWASAYPVVSTNASMRFGISTWSGIGGSLSWVEAPGLPLFDTDRAAQFTSDGVSTTQLIRNDTSASGTVTAGLSYFCNGWVYATEAIRARVAIGWVDAGGGFLSQSSGSTVTISPNTWTYLSASLLAPASAARGTVRLDLDDMAGTGSIPVDIEVYGTEIRFRRDGHSQYVQFSEDDFPLALRVSGEVVRADSCIPKFHDTFARTTANDWGTSDSGHVYSRAGGVASDYSTNLAALEGRHTLTTVSASRRSFTPAWSDELDLTSFIKTDQLSTGGSQYAGLMGRYLNGDNLYTVRLEFTTAGFLALQIQKRVLAVETTIASRSMQIQHVAGREYGLRLYIRGTDLKVQCWDATMGQAVDRPWDLETTDPDLSAASFFGFRSLVSGTNTNVNPVIAYRFGKNNYPQVFNVERSRNGVIKSLPAGADVNVNEPLFTAIR